MIMRIQLVISAGAILAMLVMISPALAQGFGCGPVGPGGCGFGPGPLGGGFGLPFGIGGCGFGDPLTGIVGLGLAMIGSVMSAAFSCIPLGLGGFGLGLPFGGFC